MILPAQVIQKKRDGGALSVEEIRHFILGFTRGEIPDYQMSALAMAICWRGMNTDETFALTRAMVESGKTIEWPHPRKSFYADKHSTGGIGDKVSLILAPLVAACGVRVPMISGRGLGPTGGTLDKLASIAGYRTDLSLDEIVLQTDRVGCCITGATPELAPADRKLYALRDVTATVACLPLIVASIMSKKLAENVDGLVFDVKWGSGAFMRTRDEAHDLARAMVAVGKHFGKRVVALITDMNQPLGLCVGNALEVRECLEILSGDEMPEDVMEVTFALAGEMLLMAGRVKTAAEAEALLQAKLESGEARAKFEEMVRAQGFTGTFRGLALTQRTRDILSPRSGYVQSIATDQIGYALIALGGGRKIAGEAIDPTVGFECPVKIGEHVETSSPVVEMHYNDEVRAAEAERLIQQAYIIGDEPPAETPTLIVERIE